MNVTRNTAVTNVTRTISKLSATAIAATLLSSQVVQALGTGDLSVPPSPLGSNCSVDGSYIIDTVSDQSFVILTDLNISNLSSVIADSFGVLGSFDQDDLTVSGLESCGFTNVEQIVNDPWTAPFDDDNFFGHRFRATDPTDNKTYDYEVGFKGATNTTFVNTRTLANAAPAANAGTDQSVVSGTRVTLSGSGNDTDGTIQTYAWTRTGGTGQAGNAALSDNMAQNPTFTDSSLNIGDDAVTHEFSLIVTDNDNAESVADTVKITITAPANTAPTANAGTDQTVNSGAAVTLSAAGSNANDSGQSLTYAWTQTGGDSVALTGADSASPSFTAPTLAVNAADQTLTFQVTVNDGVEVATDTVTITVESEKDNAAPDTPVAGSLTITTNDNGSITVSGPAEVGATVNVTFPDGNTVSAPASGTTFTITSAPSQPDGNIRVTVTDAAGNTSDALTVAHTAPDTEAPAVPTEANTNVVTNANGSITVSGTTEPGATVRVTFPDGSVGTAVADENGAYSITSAAGQPEGNVSVTVTDTAGNTSAPLTTGHTVADTTAPATPTEASTNVVTNADGTVTVSGTTEPGAKVMVTFPDGSTVIVTADANGTYSATSANAQPSGSVKVMAEDAAGNRSDVLSVSVRYVPTVDEVQQEIATYMQTRAAHVVSAQPDLIGFLSGTATGEFNMQVTRGNGNFEFATPGNRPVWARLQGQWSENGSYDNSYFHGVVGGHFNLSKDAIAGVMLQFDRLSQDDGAAVTEGDGYLFGPYFVARLPEQPLYFEGRYLVGKTDNSVSIGGAAAEQFKTKRSLLSFKVAGQLHYGELTLTPSLSATRLDDTQEAHIDTMGRVVGQQSVTVDNLSLGLDFAKSFETAGGLMQLTGGFSAIHAASKGEGFASTVIPSYEGTRGRVHLGTRYVMDSGVTLNAGASYDGIGSSGYKNIGLDFGLSMKF